MVQVRIARLVIMSALAFGLIVGGGVAAQEATPEVEPGFPPLPEGCVAVADGLLGPRFIAIGADGTLYVTETGVGGDEVIESPLAEEDGTPPPQLEEGTPPADEEAAPPSTRGYTGQVTFVTPDGGQGILSTSFASYSDGVGPEGITIGPDGLIYMAVGGAAVAAGIEPLVGENTVFVIDPASGQPTPLVELGSYEEANNPDGTDVNPNLYGVEFGADGLLYVVDAGGNTIYQVDPTTGEFALTAVVPGLNELTGAMPGETPGATPVVAGAEEDRQPVPTDIIIGPDGQLLVALLSEGWPADAPSILQLEADGSFTEVASGLAMVVALTVGPDGAIYATQLWTGFGPEGPLPGNVVRIDADGSTEVVLDGLFLPHGIAFDAVGNLFVATGSIFFGPDAPPGQVLRCEGVTGAATSVAAGTD